VYRAAIDQSASGTAAPPRAHRSVAADADAALADAAFRSLPERWRAAVWLRDVENIDADRIAIVLAVSATVAEQLVSRGRRGLAGRFAQAHRELPEHIGEVLRPLTLAIPANLSDVTAARWSSVGSDHLPLFAPISGWLEERGVRPMSVAVGALVGLGLIGLGVVPGGSSVRSQLGAAGAGNVGAVPVQTCFGLACPAGTQGSGSLAGNAVSLGLGSLSAGGTAASGSGATGSTLGGSTGSLGTGTGSSGGSGGGSGAPGGTSPSTPTPTIPGPPIVPANPTLPSAPTTLPPVVPAGTSTVTIPGVGSVSITGGSTLPTLGVTVGGTTVTTPSIGSSSTPTTTIPTISSAVQNTTSGVTNILGGL
jgi:hypothetical protein